MADQLIELKFKDGTVMLAEVTSAAPTGGQQLASGAIAHRLTADFDAISATIRNIAEEVQSAVAAAMPNSTEIEFGLAVNAETGALLAQLVNGGAKASLKITLRWEKTTATT